MSSQRPDDTLGMQTPEPLPLEAAATSRHTIAALQRAEQDKNELLIHLNHALRTPLNAIIGYGELLQEEVRECGQETLLPYVQRIEHAAAQMLTIMRNVRELVQHDLGKAELTYATFDVSALVRDVTATIQPALHTRHNTVAVHCPDSVGPMRADEERVRQSLTCLLLQANMAVESGTIRLDVSRDMAQGTTWIRFRIIDTGQGMTGDQMARVFFALAPMLTLNDDQIWQGLALSRRVCRAMHGNIDVDSASGTGSTFTMRLPADGQAISDTANLAPSP